MQRRVDYVTVEADGHAIGRITVHALASAEQEPVISGHSPIEARALHLQAPSGAPGTDEPAGRPLPPSKRRVEPECQRRLVVPRGGGVRRGRVARHGQNSCVRAGVSAWVWPAGPKRGAPEVGAEWLQAPVAETSSSGG